jgi:hypothetical protein
VYCEFGNRMDVEGANATVMLVADAAAAMEDRTSTIGEGAALSCGIQTGGGNCSAVDLVGDVYVELHAMGVVGGDEAAAEQATLSAVDELTSLAGASVAPASWNSPAGTSPLGADCEAILSPEDLAALVGTDSLVVQHPEGGWGIEGWMLSDRWSAEPCYYGEGLDEWGGPVHGQLTWLPGGEWAYEQDAAGEPLDVGQGTDRAVLNCDIPMYYPCAVDILAGRNWIRFAIFDTGDASARPALATAVAQAVIDNVSG